MWKSFFFNWQEENDMWWYFYEKSLVAVYNLLRQLRLHDILQRNEQRHVNAHEDVCFQA